MCVWVCFLEQLRLLDVLTLYTQSLIYIYLYVYMFCFLSEKAPKLILSLTEYLVL